MGCCESGESLPPLEFLPADRPKWLPTEGPGNRNVEPEDWGLTVQQWSAFVAHVSVTPTYMECMNDTNRKDAGFMNMYQLTDKCIIPWTRNTGNSVALLLNNKKPLKSKLMVSHAWGECLGESQVSLLGKFAKLGISFDTPMWFCTLSQYQPGDLEGDCGPGVAEQIARDPFKRVIDSAPPYGMLVLHTSRAELYGRLWCVFEVNEAIKAKCTPWMSLSMMYSNTLLKDLPESDDGVEKLKVNTAEANCWSPDDATVIKGKVQESGGFGNLDKAILKFRQDSFGEQRQIFRRFVDFFEKEKGSRQQGVDYIAQTQWMCGNWFLLKALFLEAHKANDVATCDIAALHGRHNVEFFKMDIHKVSQPPPGFDEAKLLPYYAYPETVAAVREEFLNGGKYNDMLLEFIKMCSDTSGPGPRGF